MELFVVNRHEEEKPENTAEEEQSKLDKVLRRIERNKQIRSKQKERKRVQQIAKQKTQEERGIKRAKKAKLVSVPEPPEQNQQFLKETDLEPEAKKLKPDLEGFTVLGAETSGKKTAAKRVLPKWLLNPTVISANLQDLDKKVAEIKLDKQLRKLLKANGIKYFFPVQAEVVPWLLQSNAHRDVVVPQDICVSAPTGSGKTLAFVLPVVQALKRHKIKKIRALVILPTQDLAMQVFKTFKLYTQNTGIDVCLVSGTNSFANEQKQLIYHNESFGFLSKVDVLVCTAGRLVDHLKLTGGFSLRFLEFLVIDEADRVLDSVQNDWLYHLEQHMEQDSKILNLFSLKKRRPQKLLFSATLSQDPEKLEKLSLFQPKLFTSTSEAEQGKSEKFIGKFTTPNELSEKFVVCSMDLKPLVLFKFVKSEGLTRTLVFTHSIESAHRLMILLKCLFKNELKIEEISSNAKNRSELIGKFSNGNIDLLICTDSLARGIDLPGVKCVISYSAPKYLKTYIHRAGRTARAGELGLAVTLLHKQQLAKFQTLLEQSEKTNVEQLEILEEDLEPLGVEYKKALKELKKTVGVEEKVHLKKIKSAKRGTKVTKIK